MIIKLKSDTTRSKCKHCGAVRYGHKLNFYQIKNTHLASKFYLCNYMAGASWRNNTCEREYFDRLIINLHSTVIPELTILLQAICQLSSNNFKINHYDKIN